jgi:hypothetical protein
VCEIVFRCTEIICFDGIVAFRCTKLMCFEEILVAKILLMPYILSVVPYIYFCSIKIVLEYDSFVGVWVSSAAEARPSATKNGCPPFALRPSEASLDSLTLADS